MIAIMASAAPTRISRRGRRQAAGMRESSQSARRLDDTLRRIVAIAADTAAIALRRTRLKLADSPALSAGSARGLPGPPSSLLMSPPAHAAGTLATGTLAKSEETLLLVGLPGEERVIRAAR